jgi:hypothetical protein
MEANRVPLYVPGELLNDGTSGVYGTAIQVHVTDTDHGGVLGDVAVASVGAKDTLFTPTQTPSGDVHSFYSFRSRSGTGGVPFELDNATGHEDFVKLSRGPAPMEFLRGFVDQAIVSIRASG